ncbi:MAG: Spy/CpxP family protein refolding chaperone [Phormidesmis sp. CAN_BIN36]|nr:Spy/CpxP family protein refolding chaperone [Phormidesmis sp. CAN_BIN36]
MKNKLFWLLPGAIALLLSAAPVLTAHAQSSAPTAPRAGERMQNRLNLTADQKARLKTIRDNVRQQIEGVLTSEQRAKLQADRSQGMKRGQGFKSLNLSADQKARMKQIRENARTQMDSVLTPEQRSKMQQNRAQRRMKPAQ